MYVLFKIGCRLNMSCSILRKIYLCKIIKRQRINIDFKLRKFYYCKISRNKALLNKHNYGRTSKFVLRLELNISTYYSLILHYLVT